MSRHPKKPENILDLPAFVELPVLTEAQVTETTILPVLTELSNTLPRPVPAAQPAPLSDEQYSQLAERLAPQLEAVLRAKLSARLGPLWQEIWSEAQAELPGLIRAELEKNSSRSRK
jgi:hypothetical protein